MILIDLPFHVHGRENGQQRGPGDLGGAVAHAAGIDAKVKDGRVTTMQASRMENVKKNGTVIERATTPSENGDLPIW